MIRYRVDIFINGVWQECQLAKIMAGLEPGSFGTFSTRAAAESFCKDWPPRVCQKESLRVMEVGK